MDHEHNRYRFHANEPLARASRPHHARAHRAEARLAAQRVEHGVDVDPHEPRVARQDRLLQAPKRRLAVPVVVDAGVGTASDACLTMEQGVDGILMNTALAAARDPVAMAHAMRLAVEAGRAAFLAGRMPRREVAVPSSPTEGMLD